MLTNPRRGWQLDSIVGPVHELIITFFTTLGRWLQGELSRHMLELTPKMLANPRRGWLLGELSKHRLELSPKMLANPRRGWQLESMVKPVEGLITAFMATLSRWLEGELSKHRLELTP